MDSKEQNKKIELLKEKFNRHEQILIQAYKSLKKKEEALKKLNIELCTNQEELRTINDELLEKNDIIQNQNTELKATLQDLKATQVQLLQAEKMASLGTLTAGVAHEINNPLNYIMGSYMGLSNYFQKKGIVDNPKISFLLDSLKIGLDRSVAIVKGLDQFSMQSNSNNEECNLHAIIDNCLLMLQNQFRNKVKLEKDYHEEQLIVRGNSGNLHQVFLNILANATQAIVENGFITIRSQKRKKVVIIEIIDSGSGIAKENMAKITDPFFTTKDPGKGAGLGLSIAYSIIQDHKGKLEYDSVLGEGTTLRVILPL